MKMSDIDRVISEMDSFCEACEVNNRFVDEVGDMYPVDTLPISDELKAEALAQGIVNPLHVEVWRGYRTTNEENWLVVRN